MVYIIIYTASTSNNYGQLKLTMFILRLNYEEKLQHIFFFICTLINIVFKR